MNFHRTKRRSRCTYCENFHGTYPQRLVALREFSRNVTPSLFFSRHLLMGYFCLSRAAPKLTSPYVHVPERPPHKIICTLSNSYCTLCVPKHSILGPGQLVMQASTARRATRRATEAILSYGLCCVRLTEKLLELWAFI